MGHLVTMPYKDPEKRREFLKRWREKNRETLNARRQKRAQEKKRVRELRVVLTPLTHDECQVSLERLQRRKAVARDVECRACAERAREKAERVQASKRRKLEQNRAWKKANREKVREYKREWREKNRERVNEQRRNKRKKAREQKRQWVEKNRERDREQKQRWRQNNRERNREQKRRWRQLNREKDREQRRKQRQADPEKVREQQRRRRQADPEKARARERKWYQTNRERLREQKQRWRKNNPEKVAAQKRRERVKLKADEERRRVDRENRRQQNQRWRCKHPEKGRVRMSEWRKKNPEKRKAQRERCRETNNAICRRYHAAHREERNRATRVRYYKKRGRPVPLPPPPCDFGLCVACGGWGVSWKPAWYARLDAFCAPKDPSTPATILEELPLDLLESETETMSLASTSEIESELGDRLDSLLMDVSDSEVETGDQVEAPTRRSTRIAKMPSVSYKDWDEEEKLVREFLNRKEQLHADGVDRIVTRWELLERRTERVDAIVNEMSTGMDPTHQLDRFHSQLERQDYVLDVMVSEDLLDFVDGQLA